MSEPAFCPSVLISDITDSCGVHNSTEDRFYEQQIKWRQKLVFNHCSTCNNTTTVPKTDLNTLLCQDSAGSQAQHFRNILVDEKNKLIYCMIPKVASTNWKRTLLRLREGNYDKNLSLFRGFNIHSKRDLRQIGFTFLDLYSYEERQTKLNEYFKFMFVRNPFDRLLSAYRDKFTRDLTWSVFFQRKYGRAIINMMRPNASEEVKANGTDVTFTEFIKYIIASNQANRLLNVHWTPYHRLCQPCQIKYDFVGKFETLEADANWVISKVSGKKCPFRFPSENLSPRMSIKSVMRYYRDLGANVMSDLYDMFQSDFDMFSYEIQRVARTGQIVI